MLAQKFQDGSTHASPVSSPESTSPACLEDNFEVRNLQPRTLAGLSYLAIVLLTTGVALVLSTRLSLAPWIAGQLLFALAFLQWFVVLHEAGHQTLFSGRKLNLLVGHFAGFLALIPFRSWRSIHARHHRWTGWQDKDATTASLVPRKLGSWEKYALRLAWGTCFPLTSVLYRWNNYWYLPRVRKFLPESHYPGIRNNVLGSLFLYLLLGFFLGSGFLVQTFGLGLFLSFVAQDILLLSQHTHIPQKLSEGAPVRPFSPEEQLQFTRSLRFPAWFSFLILHFDAHELHHRFVSVPGYDLRKIPLPTARDIHWWTWLREAKKIPGDIFFFHNSDETGFPW